MEVSEKEFSRMLAVVTLDHRRKDDFHCLLCFVWFIWNVCAEHRSALQPARAHAHTQHLKQWPNGEGCKMEMFVRGISGTELIFAQFQLFSTCKAHGSPPPTSPPGYLCEVSSPMWGVVSQEWSVGVSSLCFPLCLVQWFLNLIRGL